MKTIILLIALALLTGCVLQRHRVQLRTVYGKINMSMTPGEVRAIAGIPNRIEPTMNSGEKWVYLTDSRQDTNALPQMWISFNEKQSLYLKQVIDEKGSTGESQIE